MTPPSVCFLSSIHDLRDKRVFYKEAATLADAGFDVTHIAPGLEGEIHSVREQRVQLLSYPAVAGRWGRLLGLPRLYRVAKGINADYYHCNEPDSWLVGILLRIRLGAGVVFDVHEHYPSRFGGGRLPRWLQPLGALGVRVLFRLGGPMTNRIVLAKQSLEPDFARFAGKVVMVQNFAPLSLRGEKGDLRRGRPVGAAGTRVTAIHLGLMSRVRGWPQLLEALTLCRNENLQVILMGTFVDGSEGACAARIGALNLSTRISSHGWRPMADALATTRTADIGLVLFQPGIQNHVFALPHKLFDYMLAGLPVIVPRFAVDVAEIVRQADCGILVDSSNPVEIAEALDRLARDADLRERLGRNGHRAVVERYNWEQEGARLVEMYRSLLADARRGHPEQVPEAASTGSHVEGGRICDDGHAG